VLDYPLWRSSGHNPVQQLHEISPERLSSAAGDSVFLSLYDQVASIFDKEMADGDSWLATTHPTPLPGPVAYFSMEYAIHNSLPIYAGGLGVLAGDLCKEASDLGLPLVAVGFMYPQGYFRQQVSAEGWQVEVRQQLDFNKAPVIPVLAADGQKCLAEVRLKNRTLHIRVWLVKLGRAKLYLLDTDIEENDPHDRQLSSHLYTADRENRLQQELLLGIGGVRILRKLGIQPSVWHANEGHTAFMILERIREEVAGGASFAEALARVQRTSAFTTHTPVPAGNDTFPSLLVEPYFESYWPSLGIDRKTFMDLGRQSGTEDPNFNMTILALKTSSYRNAVSRLHGRVTRRMWHRLWPDHAEDDVPITHITNGIHVPTWVAAEFRQLYEKYLGPDWEAKHDETQLWQHVAQIPDEELWRTRQVLKRKLFNTILERAQDKWARGTATPQVVSAGSLLGRDAITIGFVRRFTEYKRPALLFRDPARLKKLVGDRERPVQLIFAGKSHPADLASKTLLRYVYNMAGDREFQGRIAFLEDYDMHLARYLVQGVDVWLNTPRRLQEACGTSGMKAALNGVLHLSVPDGWWQEAASGRNGWTIGDDATKASAEEEDRADAEALYRLLEEKVIPLYYERDKEGIPRGWVAMMKESIRSIVPTFSARRMLKEYCEKVYLPAGKP